MVTLSTIDGQGIRFNGKYDLILDINVLNDHPFNKVWRNTETEESKEEYNNLEKGILRDGLHLAIPVTYDGNTYVLEGGHTRKKVLIAHGAIEAPIIITENNTDDVWDEKTIDKHFSDNTRVNTPAINRYMAIKKIIEEWSKRNIEYVLEDLCSKAGLSVKLFTAAKHIEYGYTNKLGQWVRPRPDLLEDLVKGEKSYANISKCYAIMKQDHDKKHNPKSKDYARNSKFEKVLEKINTTFISATKKYINVIKDIRIEPYPFSVFDYSDEQSISGIIHYAVNAYFCTEINKHSNFTAKVSKNSDHYDIYVYDKANKIVATIETKTTKGKNWSSQTPKGGYHLLVSYNPQLTSFYASVAFFDSETWSGGVKGSYTLKCKDVYEKNEYMFEYAGEITPDGNVYNINKTSKI